MITSNLKPQTSNIKPVTGISVLTVIWIILTVIPVAGADPVAVPVYEEPRHRLVFDKAPVKIMNVNIPPGDVSLYHYHEDPTLYIAIGGALMRSQDLGKEWGKPDPNSRHGTGSFVFRNYRLTPQSHRVENLDQSSFRLVGIVHKGPGTAVKVKDPEAGIDNDWFRGRRFHLAPGTGTPMHLHEHPVLVVQVSDGSTHVVTAGRPTAEKTVTGNWSWHPAGSRHVLQNTGSTDTDLVEVEIK